MNEVTTTNLAHFGRKERIELIALLNAWVYQGLPKDFYDDEVVPMLNRKSGFVFLTNSDFQCCMMNGDKLEQWLTCGECGNEGFAEDIQLFEDSCNECCQD